MQGAVRRCQDRRDRLHDDRRRGRPALHREPRAASSSIRCTRAARTSSTRTTCFFDLDPFPPYTYEDVLTVARHIKVLLDQLGLPGFPKTSGATGLQIFVPVERGRYTYDQVRAFVGRCGRLILQADPDRVTMAWKIADRTGKTFIDHNMNRSGREHRGRLLVAPRAAGARLHPAHLGRGLRRAGSSRRTSASTTSGNGSTRVGDLFAGHARGGGRPDERVRGAGESTSPRDQRRERRRRERSAEIIAASKDPNLAEYIRKRDFEGTPEPAPGERRGAGQLVRDPQAPSDAAALRRAT